MPSVIVIHYTAMKSAQAAIERLCDPEAEVSAHYLIDRFGDATQLVEEDKRAWHAGAGEWRGQPDVNSHSIGIELDNEGTHPFSEPQMNALEALLRDLMERWSIEPENVIGHSDMAPGRKIDPGPRFDWARLSRQGLACGTGRPTDAADPSPEQFREAAALAGYTAKADDKTLLQTVRFRHRPFATGPLCRADLDAVTRPKCEP